jgi:hypothetical protein
MNQSNEGSKEPLKVRRKPFRSGGPRDSAFSTRLPALPDGQGKRNSRRPAPTTDCNFSQAHCWFDIFVARLQVLSIIGPGAGDAAVEVIVRPRHHAAQSEARDVDCDLQPAPQLQDGMVVHEVSSSRACVCARKREICVGVLNSKRDRVGEDESVCVGSSVHAFLV